MNAITETVDKPDGVCQQASPSETVSLLGETGAVGTQCETVGVIKFTHGGYRSGAGRKPKPIAPTQITYAIDTPLWCVLAFWGQAEISGARELTRIGYETCMPMVAIRRQDPVLTSLWHTIRVPLFPGYGFIRLSQSESREPITATRGIREVLRRPDGRAASVPDLLIAKLIEDAPKRLELPKEHGPVLDKGAHVRIETGAFASHLGTVKECDGVKTQVEVFVFGRPTPVWLDRVAVVKI